jgi:hypothetical protein
MVNKGMFILQLETYSLEKSFLIKVILELPCD